MHLLAKKRKASTMGYEIPLENWEAYERSQRRIWKFGSLGLFDSRNDTIHQLRRQFAIIDSTLIIFSLIFNVVVLVVVCGTKSGRATISMTAVSIAVSNLFMSVLVHPTSIFISILPRVLDPLICKFSVYFDCWMSTTIAYSIVALHIDRYFAMTSPGSRSLNGHCMFYLSFLWFFAAAYSVWDLVFEYPQNVTIAMSKNTSSESMKIDLCKHTGNFRTLELVFQYMDVFVLFVIPFTIWCILMFLILKQKYCAHRHAKRRLRGATSKWRLTMAFLYSLVFYLCHLPSHITGLLWGNPDSTTYNLQHYQAVLTVKTIKYSCGSILPVIYFICSHEVKAAIQLILKRSSTLPGETLPRRGLLYIADD